MGLTKTSYLAPEKQILIGQESYYIGLGARVTNTGVTADSNGKKILYAGTPLAGDLLARDTAFTKAVTSGDTSQTSNATCVLLHDVDVTNGAENATVVLAGCIDILKLTSATQALITNEVKTALPRIIFVKGSAI